MPKLPGLSIGPKARPTQWKKVGQIDRIYIYPLKSGKGIPVEEAIVNST